MNAELAKKYGYVFDPATNNFIPNARYQSMKAKLRAAASDLVELPPFQKVYHIPSVSTLTEEKGNEE